MESQTHGRAKRSPRAPSIPLDDAIDRAIRVYEKERHHVVPIDVVAKALGYSGAKNGSALTTIATLRYYGLLERPKQGFLAVSRDVGEYKANPNVARKHELRRKWLRNPPIFSELLDKYAAEGELPSEDALRWEFIQRDFSESSAAECAGIFTRSVAFAQYFEGDGEEEVEQEDQRHALVVAPRGETHQPTTAPEGGLRGGRSDPSVPIQRAALSESPAAGRSESPAAAPQRIPIRLPGPGQRFAWLEVPLPFYAADKAQISRQLEIMITDDVTEEN